MIRSSRRTTSIPRGLLIAAVAAFAVTGAVASAAHAQEGSLRIEVVNVAEEAFPSARAIVNVEDTSTGGLPELAPESFAVTVDGAPGAVTGAELANSEDAPLDVVVVIDTSGSMEGAPLVSAKAAASAFINDLGAADRVAILSFGDEVTLVQDFTADRALSGAAIDGLIARGNTALYQATTVAAVKAGSSNASRRAIVLLSDGADFGGRSIATREESIAAATNAGVPLFTIAQGNDLDRVYLQEVAAVSKGRYLEAPNPQDLASLYADIGRLLRSQYVVTFDATAAAGKPEALVSVTLTANERVAESQRAFRPTAGFTPGIEIAGLLPGETFDTPRVFNVIGSSIPDGASIVWYVDDVPVLETGEPPFTFSYDPSAFVEGTHMLRASLRIGAASIDSPAIAFSSTPGAASGDSGLPVLPIGVAIAALAAIGGGVVYVQRARRNRGPAPIPVDQRTVPWVSQIAQARKDIDVPDDDEQTLVLVEEVGETKGILISRAGADVGAEYAVGGTPVSVGSGAGCAVRIDDPELGTVEARIWVRGGHLMLHKMTRLSAIAADGTTGGWSILDEGDKFEVGEHTYEFRLVQPDAPASALSDDEGIVPNVLRDPDIPRRDGGQSPADSSRLKFSELMPRDDGGLMPGAGE